MSQNMPDHWGSDHWWRCLDGCHGDFCGGSVFNSGLKKWNLQMEYT